MIASSAIRVIAPATMPVALQELKAQVRYFDSDEDATLLAFLRSSVEEAENYTGLGLITQTWKQSWSAFPTLPSTSLKLQRYMRQAIMWSPSRMR
jgi:uncharacterized phiE125 gp8 family phage protein